MAGLSLREAAEQCGVSKSTVFRAIRAGRMSAARDDDGNFSIDPAELFRVYPPKPTVTNIETVAGDVPEATETHAKGQDAPAVFRAAETELRIRNAELEAQLNALKQILETEKQRSEQDRQRVDQQVADLRAERDRWASALEASQRQITHLQQQEKAAERRGWFGWLKRA